MRRIWLLHNTRAGSPKNVRRVDNAAEALARRGVAVQLERPDDSDGLRQAAQAAVAGGADAVFVAGGDGTVGAVAGELAGTPVALGALPAGTANVWARTLGLARPGLGRPGTIERTALLLADSPVRLTDIGRCNDEPFLVWASVGLDAFVVGKFEERRQVARNMGGFYFNFLLTLRVARHWRGSQLSARVICPGGERELNGRYIMLTVANTGWHGGGLLRMARDVRLDDGLMDVWAVAGDGYADVVAHAVRVLRGTHLRHPDMQRLTAERLEIYTPAPQAYHIDAEPRMFSDRLAITVSPRCLRLLVPPRAARELYA
jgi:diacylglycerol kinase (ATP)